MPDPYVDSTLHDVGHGEGFGVSLYYLYKAGRVHLPEVAATYSELAMRVHRQAPLLDILRSGSGPLSEQVHQRLRELRDEFQHVLRRSAINIDDSGRALVTIADAYAATDETAAAAFATKIDDEANLVTEAIHVPRPPAPGDPQPSTGIGDPTPAIPV